MKDKKAKVKGAARSATRSKETLTRTVFKLSREIEFFTEKELAMQVGHPKYLWYAAIFKELVDNALDACESHDVVPEIRVTEAPGFYEVQDNGPGLPSKTLEGSLNYLLRVSDKQFYVSPTRGQMGNALKCVWAAPYVSRGKGTVEIWAQGLHHTIDTTLDRIANRPVITHKEESSDVRIGTRVRVWWPDSASGEEEEDGYSYNSSETESPTLQELLQSYSAFNPHTSFVYQGEGGKEIGFAATTGAWEKWRTDQPTSPHWYNEFTLRDLIAAYVAHERDNGGSAKTVREFCSEFRGLSATAKQKAIGFSRVYLHDLVKDNDIDIEVVKKLHEVMKEHSGAVKPAMLGLLGSEHFKSYLNPIADLRTFGYRKRTGVDAYGLPYNCEMVFATKKNQEENRTVLTGLNWSPTLGNPIEEIKDSLGYASVNRFDPVIIIIHVAKPRFEFLDRGKTRMAIR